MTTDNTTQYECPHHHYSLNPMCAECWKSIERFMSDHKMTFGSPRCFACGNPKNTLVNGRCVDCCIDKRVERIKNRIKDERESMLQ